MTKQEMQEIMEENARDERECLESLYAEMEEDKGASDCNCRQFDCLCCQPFASLAKCPTDDDIDPDNIPF